MLQQNLQQLRALKLMGIAQALESQLNNPQTYENLCFEERISLLINQEISYRNDRRLQRLLTAAKFKINAAVDQIDYSHPRGLKQAKIAGFLTHDWIKQHQNITLTGSTGCGKTFIACALGNNACHHGYSVRYYRATRLFEALTMSHGDGSYLKLINQIAKADVLIIDDWGLDTLSQSQRNDLLEIMEDRHGNKSTIVTSQLPTDKWHSYIGDPTLADAILDRLIHNSHTIKLKGESMRKIMSSLTDHEHLV